MPLVQMVKTFASADYMLETGKVYKVSDELASGLLADNACLPFREANLPKGKKKAALMPDPRPDPQFGNGADGKQGAKKQPAADLDSDEDEEEDA